MAISTKVMHTLDKRIKKGQYLHGQPFSQNLGKIHRLPKEMTHSTTVRRRRREKPKRQSSLSVPIPARYGADLTSRQSFVLDECSVGKTALRQFMVH